jgi:hypothetical protein
VTVTDDNGCTDTDCTVVTVNPSTTADAGADQEVCEGGSVEIGGSPTASGGTSPYTYSWSPTTGLDDHTIANPTASPASTTTYCVTVTDDNGCTDTDCTVVTVITCEYEFYMPLVSKYPTPTPTSTPTPTNTPTPTRTPTPTKTPKPPTPTPSCEEKVCNGGFEEYACWIIPETPRKAAYSSVMWRTGSQSMRLGITSESNADSWSSIRQQVTIPGNAASATLSFWYYPICQDPYLWDWQEAIIYDATLTHILAYAMPRSCSNSQTWTHRTFDLMPYKGQTITLYFNVKNNGQCNKAAMYLDDVSVEVCY